jgi:hypothetical protein
MGDGGSTCPDELRRDLDMGDGGSAMPWPDELRRDLDMGDGGSAMPWPFESAAIRPLVIIQSIVLPKS